MAITTSCHMGSTISFAHNARDRHITDKEEHIKRNGRHITYKGSVGINGETLRSKYDKIFGEATEAYNAKQKKPCRKIDSYYDHVKAQQDKAKDSGNKAGRKLAYEIILTIGDYTNYNKGMNEEQIDPEKAIKLLTKACSEVMKENPHIKCVGCYIHADEYHKEVIDGKEVEVMGAPHAHFDFVPVADGYKKGLSIQNGMNKALQLDGYKGSDSIKDTPQMAFERAVVDKLDKLVEKELKLEVTHPIRDSKAKEQRIIKHLTKNEYVIDRQRQKWAEVKEQNQAEERKHADLKEQTQEQENKLAETNAELTEVEAKVNAQCDELEGLSDTFDEVYNNLSNIRNGAIANIAEISDAVDAANKDLKELEPVSNAIVEKFEALKPIKKGFWDKDKSIEYEVRLSQEEVDGIIKTQKEVPVLKHKFSLLDKLADKVKEVVDGVNNLFFNKGTELHMKEKELSKRANELDDREGEIERVMSGQAYQDKAAEVDKKQKELDDLTDQGEDLQKRNQDMQNHLREVQDRFDELNDEYKAKKRSQYEEQFLDDHKEDLDEYIEEKEEQEREYEDDEWCL